MAKIASFITKPNGTFKEVAEQAGVAGTARNGAPAAPSSTTTAMAKLDLAVANYVHFDLAHTPVPGQGRRLHVEGVPVMCGPRGLQSAPNILFHNLGGGDSRDVSKASGFEKTNGHYCFSITTLDYNNDGWPDLYFACDSTPSILYRNNHDGTFTDTAAEVGVAYNEDGREQAGMGSTRRLRLATATRSLQDKLLRRHLYPLPHKATERSPM